MTPLINSRLEISALQLTSGRKNYTPTVGCPLAASANTQSGASRAGYCGAFGSLLAGLLDIADHRFLNLDGPIDFARVDDQMIQARILSHIGNTASVAPVIDRFLQRPPADRAVHDEVE